MRGFKIIKRGIKTLKVKLKPNLYLKCHLLMSSKIKIRFLKKETLEIKLHKMMHSKNPNLRQKLKKTLILSK